MDTYSVRGIRRAKNYRAPHPFRSLIVEWAERHNLI